MLNKNQKKSFIYLFECHTKIFAQLYLCFSFRTILYLEIVLFLTKVRLNFSLKDSLRKVENVSDKFY